LLSDLEAEATGKRAPATAKPKTPPPAAATTKPAKLTAK
jgi:hypothetical protein